MDRQTAGAGRYRKKLEAEKERTKGKKEELSSTQKEAQSDQFQLFPETQSRSSCWVIEENNYIQIKLMKTTPCTKHI